MFARWLSVKIQAAENALADGRIDDALQIAAERGVRESRRAASLLGGLARAVLARARLHAQAGRYADALEDLDKLAVIDRNGPDADALRERITNDMKHRRRDRDERHEAYERAAANLRAGRLESGRIALEQLPVDDRKREQLAEDLDIRMKRGEQLIEQAAAALKAGELLVALQMWEDARTRHGRTNESERFAQDLAREYRKTLDGWFARGSLDRFMAAVRAGGSLHGIDATLDEYETARTLVAKAASQMSRADHQGMRRTLMRLSGTAGEAKWIKELLAHLDALLGAQDRLYASPLGVFSPSVQKTQEVGMLDDTLPLHNKKGRDPDVARGAAAKRGAPVRGKVGDPVGQGPLLLLVDGTGSSLLIRRNTVRIGRAGGNADIDVPLPADMQSHHADILRQGDDYFLMAVGPTEVNRRRVTRTLLRDGDRIVMGNGKMVFRRSSDRSGSAVLVLSDRTRAPQDVDRVVLFADTCLIGPDPSCHIRTREGDTRLVAFVRDGQLLMRRRPRNGRHESPDEAEPLELGWTKDIGDLRMTLKTYDERVGHDRT
jgi:tetratricopeptide (TPR) repeat protein